MSIRILGHKWVFSAWAEGSVAEMIRSLCWTSLAHRRKEKRATTNIDVQDGKRTSADANREYIDTIKTRVQNDHKFRHIGTRTSCYRSSFFPRTTPEWDELGRTTTSAEYVYKLLQRAA